MSFSNRKNRSNSKSESPSFKEWLEILQQESWQLELLISGLALIGIWSSRGLLLEVDYYLQVNSYGDAENMAKFFVSILWFSWAIFLTNLLIHIIVRGMWIGAIGLRYVSGDIDFDELNYSKTFTDYYQKKIVSYDHFIEKLERFSSVIFSFTFLLFFMLLSFFTSLFIVIFVGNIIGYFTDNSTSSGMIYGLLFALYGFFGLIVFVDFLTLGGLKKVKDPGFSKVYLWIYRFFSFISLSFLYRPILLNFIDNSYTRRLFFISIPYALLIIFGFNFYFERYAYIPSFNETGSKRFYTDQNTVDWNFYDDLRAVRQDKDHLSFSRKNKIQVASLSAYEYERDEASIFLEYEKEDSDILKKKLPEITPYKKVGFGHNSFSRKEKDENYNALESHEIKEILFMLSVTNNEEQFDYLDLFKDKLNYYQQFGPEHQDSLRTLIKQAHLAQEIEYRRNKSETIKDGLLELYSIQVDGIEYRDSMNCKFYTHENMGEKGLLCYFSIKQLSHGEHLIRLKKKNSLNGGSRRMFLPFRKLNQ